LLPRMREASAEAGPQRARVRAAGAAARVRVHEQSWQAGVRRESLFEQGAFLRKHGESMAALQASCAELFVPTASPTWTKEARARRRQDAAQGASQTSADLGGALPAEWRAALPAALSLERPLGRVSDEFESRFDSSPASRQGAREGAASGRRASPSPEPEPQPASLAAAERPQRPPPPKLSPRPPAPRAALGPCSSEMRVPAPLLHDAPEDDDDTLANASAVYLTSLRYLEECGIHIPFDEDPLEGGRDEG